MPSAPMGSGGLKAPSAPGNDVSKTTIAVYSLRARARPTVSTPLMWDEVEQCLEREDPKLLAFESNAVLERVEQHGDLFAPVLELQQELPEGIV